MHVMCWIGLMGASAAICSVADVAELVRSVSPRRDWSDAADSAYQRCAGIICTWVPSLETDWLLRSQTSRSLCV